MDYKSKIVELLKNNMTERSFLLWNGINRILPDIWNKPTSSTGKYHKKMNGETSTQAEHVYQMLYTAIKIIKIFNIDLNTIECDKILFAIALHDSLKYGNLGSRLHTDIKHDREAADMIASNKEAFLKIFDEKQFTVLEEMVRFHSGHWSTDLKHIDFPFDRMSKESLFIHILDVMSSKDLIQTDIRE